MTDAARSMDADRHVEPCEGTTCPCYLEGIQAGRLQLANELKRVYEAVTGVGKG